MFDVQQTIDYAMFRNNQQMRQFLSVYYFTLLVLHVSATVCSSVPSELHANLGFLVDKTLCSMWMYMLIWRPAAYKMIRASMQVYWHIALTK
jgi:cellulose synthase/poly-beta-1,6-N-acetylglucosamine synthase-like glycosyltransferase